MARVQGSFSSQLWIRGSVLAVAMAASSAFVEQRTGLPDDPIMEDSQETLELGAQEPEVTLEHEWTIRTNLHKKSWTVNKKDLQEIKGMMFIRLSKFDRNFVFFCTGKGLQMNKCQATSCNVAAFDALVQSRKKASLEMIQPVLQAEGLKRKPREEDKDLLPRPYVRVMMPAFDWDAGVVGPLEVNMVWSLKSSDLWIEFRSETWLYLKSMVMKGLQDQEYGRTRRTAKQQCFGSPKRSPKKKAKKASPKKKSPKMWSKFRKPTRFNKAIVAELEMTGAAHSQPQTSRDWNNLLGIPQSPSPSMNSDKSD